MTALLFAEALSFGIVTLTAGFAIGYQWGAAASLDEHREALANVKVAQANAELAYITLLNKLKQVLADEPKIL
jgi:hypothetical protein